MNTILLFLIGIPVIEIFVMIKIGQNIGAFNTIFLIFLTAIIGIYIAKMQGLSTLRSGVYSRYKNKIPLFELISGASIALAACLVEKFGRKMFVFFAALVASGCSFTKLSSTTIVEKIYLVAAVLLLSFVGCAAAKIVGTGSV